MFRGLHADVPRVLWPCPCLCCRAVHSGSVVAYSKQDEGDKVAMYKGSFFGEEVLLTHNPDTVLRRSKTVQALTMCHLYILEASDFREVIKVSCYSGRAVCTMNGDLMCAWVCNARYIAGLPRIRDHDEGGGGAASGSFGAAAAPAADACGD